MTDQKHMSTLERKFVPILRKVLQVKQNVVVKVSRFKVRFATKGKLIFKPIFPRQWVKTPANINLSGKEESSITLVSWCSVLQLFCTGYSPQLNQFIKYVVHAVDQHVMMLWFCCSLRPHLNGNAAQAALVMLLVFCACVSP